MRRGEEVGEGTGVEFPLQTEAVHENIFGILWYHINVIKITNGNRVR